MDVLELAHDEDLDVLALTETWLQTGEKALCAEIKDVGFNIQHTPRKTRGGGVGVISTRRLRMEKVKKQLTTKSFEYQEVLLKVPTLVRLLVIYRPGNTASFSDFLCEFESLLHVITERREPTIICGDFNTHMEKVEDPCTKKFQNLLNDFGWSNIVCEKTHVAGGTLDLVLVQRCKEDLIELSNIQVLPVPVVPDHFLVTFEADISKPPCKRSVIHCRKLKDVHSDMVVERILVSDLCGELPTELDDCVKLYNTTLRDVLDELAPLEERTVKENDRAKWWTAECTEATRIRRAAERKWLDARAKSFDTGKLTYLYNSWKTASKSASKIINCTRTTYYLNRLEILADDGKATYEIVNKLLDNEKIPSTLPSTDPPDVLVTKFNEFFRNKVLKIYEDIENQATLDETPPCTPTTSHSPDSSSSEVPSAPFRPLPSSSGQNECEFDNFKSLSDDELLKIIRGMGKKTCSLDPMPSSMISSCLLELLPTISEIVNGSLRNGVFPDAFKEAVIRPSYKGKGLSSDDLGSYRPISNLPFVSKIIEKCVAIQLTEYLEKNKLLSGVQSAYRKFHSCETATLKILNDVALLLDKKSKVILLLLDLSAAFDTVSHTALLHKLESQYRIKGNALAWFSSYLRGRSTSVQIGNCRSESIDVEIGVPQGSILGPILFIIYTRELQKIAEQHGLKIHLFADDTQIYTSFTPDSFNTVVATLQNCIMDIKVWMRSNYLKLNAGKTEVLILNNKADKSPNPVSIILEPNEDPVATTAETGIKCTFSARNLGIWFDPLLSMSSHISKVVQACNIQLLNLWRIAKKLPKKLKIKLVHTLIHSRLDYGNALLFGITEREISRLQKIQNNAVRFIHGTRKRRGVTQMRKDLHFLPIKSRIDFKICLMAYKAINGFAPSYISDLIPLRTPKTKTHRANSDSTLLEKRSYRHKYSSTTKAFSICAPKLWNSLPRDIRESKSVEMFKKRLKTHLFDKAYN